MLPMQGFLGGGGAPAPAQVDPAVAADPARRANGGLRLGRRGMGIRGTGLGLNQNTDLRHDYRWGTGTQAPAPGTPGQTGVPAGPAMQGQGSPLTQLGGGAPQAPAPSLADWFGSLTGGGGGQPQALGPAAPGFTPPAPPALRKPTPGHGTVKPSMMPPVSV